MEVRAELGALALQSTGAILDHKYAKRESTKTKIRVGIVDVAVASRSETYVTLPALRLDRNKFSIYLISTTAPLSQELESICRSLVDEIIILPNILYKQVETIRQLDLDVIIIGSNTSAVTNTQFLLSLHRLARIQLVSYCSPVTTGIKNVDAFLSGSFSCTKDAQEQFTERLLQIQGPPGCMDFGSDRKPPVRFFSKADFGITNDEILYISGANCFKILPEIQEVWAEILDKVPRSRLLIHPFNPNWTNNYPYTVFKHSITNFFTKRGIDLNRLIISQYKLPTRSDVVALMAIGDIYLDTFPYSGSISLTDPLETGVPTIVCESKSLRSRQGAALLRDIGVEELIALNAKGYIKKAIQLANNQERRNEIRSRILSAVNSTPLYLNADMYGRKLGLLLEEIVHQNLVLEN